MNVGKPLVEAYLLNFTRTCILERGLMSAIRVEKLSDGSHPSFFIREFIIQGRAMDVMNVGKASIRKQPLVYIREFMVERRSLTVGRP